MNRFLKIVFLVLLVLPIWLTIVAFAEPASGLDAWKERINSQLLQNSGRKIQVTEIISKASDFDPTLASASFVVDTASVRAEGISDLALRFTDSEGRLRKLTRLRVKLFIQDEVSVAVRHLNTGDIIEASDLRAEWRDASRIRSGAASFKEIVGRKVKSPIAENEVISDHKILKPQLVSRGDRVKVSVVGGGIVISGMGIAQEGGSKGETIKVINGDSRKEILAVITEARAVEVKL